MSRNDQPANSNYSPFLRVNPPFRSAPIGAIYLSMNAFPADREEFLRDLNLVCASFVVAPRIESFLADLDRVQARFESGGAGVVTVAR